MKRVVTAACALFALGATPAMAQAISTANPCALGRAGTFSYMILFSVGGAGDQESDRCLSLQQARLAFEAAKQFDDPTYKQAATQIFCSIDGMREKAPALCGPAAAPVAARPSVSPATAYQAPTPRPVIPAAPAIVAALSDEHRPPRQVATPPKPCVIPAGVPASQWSGCWAR